MRPFFSTLALVMAASPLGAPAAAQAATQNSDPAQAGPASNRIIVTGPRVEDYRNRLAACLARHCPVNEDVDATMALTEMLFLNGDYEDARRTVRASLGRNRNQAAHFPEPVSDLYRVHGMLSRQLGFDRVALHSTHGILNALEEGLPREDHRHFTARLEIVEAQMAQGRFLGAKRGLAELARHARAAGREDVAIMAELRGMWLDYVYFPYGDTRPRLVRMARLADPAQRIRMVGAKVLLSRIYRLEGDDQGADALLADIGRANSARRRLLHAPSYRLLQQEQSQTFELGASPFISGTAVAGGMHQPLTNNVSALNTGNALQRLPDNLRDRWIDVGFWVTPEGRVTDLEILRHGARPDWADPLLESIRGRRYTTAESATYRLERYTYTSRVEPASGTRALQHSPRARVEYFDLTLPDQPAPAPPSPPSGQ